MVLPEEHTSPDGAITLEIVDIGGGDYAIGFRGYPWHTHPVIQASICGLPETKAVRDYVDAILADESIIAIRSIDGEVRDVWITYQPESELRYMESNETTQFRYWSGRPYVLP